MSVEEVKTELKECDPIFDLMKDKKLEECLEYVKENKLKEIDCLDTNGTTPLQYAAFRSYYDLCKLLISKGADVNAKNHDQGYTALMFAAIANCSEIVDLLLENEADIEYTNAIGRNASQMAAFVNSNECVDLLKGYIPKKSLEYYTNITGISETEAKLPKGECCNELYNLLTKSVNYSPVHVVKAIKLAPVLLENIEKIIKTLDAFITKSVKDQESGCPNEILAFKLHYYKYMFEYLQAQQKLAETREGNEPKENEEQLFDTCVKRLLMEENVESEDVETKEKYTHSYRVFEEKFLRESIRKFSYPAECGIIQQLVTILSQTPIGVSPSALKAITDCLNGQRMGDAYERKICATCMEKRDDVKICTHCRQVAYCDQYCQRMHWPVHKKQTIQTK